MKTKQYNFTEKSSKNLHKNILPKMNDGDQLVVEYTNKYNDKKTMVFVLSFNEKGHKVLTSQNRKFNYEQDYITYEFYNSYSNYREGYNIVSSVFIK